MKTVEVSRGLMPGGILVELSETEMADLRRRAKDYNNLGPAEFIQKGLRTAFTMIDEIIAHRRAKSSIANNQ